MIEGKRRESADNDSLPAEEFDGSLEAHDVALAPLVVPPQHAAPPVRKVAAPGTVSSVAYECVMH